MRSCLLIDLTIIWLCIKWVVPNFCIETYLIMLNNHCMMKSVLFWSSSIYLCIFCLGSLIKSVPKIKSFSRISNCWCVEKNEINEILISKFCYSLNANHTYYPRRFNHFHDHKSPGSYYDVTTLNCFNLALFHIIHKCLFFSISTLFNRVSGAEFYILKT